MIYLNIILFWISTIGYCLYIKYKFNIESELLLPIVFSFIGTFIFFMGLLNILSLGSILTVIGGVVLGIISIKKNMNDIKYNLKHPNVNLIIIGIMLLYTTIVFFNMHFLHYDCFTHWATIIKNLILNNSFPNFLNTAIEFQAYQPGSACFIYYFAHLCDIKEGLMIIGQNYLIIAFSSSLLVFAKNKYKNLFRILSIVSIIFLSLTNILPTDLLVDTLLSSILISAFVFVIYYSNNLRKTVFCLIPITLFLTLVKNSGILLVLISCLLLFIISIKKGKWKQGFKSCFLLMLTSISILYLWSAHVRYGFGASGLQSHHAMSIYNILNHLKMLGFDGIISFIKLYFNHFIDFKNNMGNIIMIIVNAILVSTLFFYKKNKKDIIYSTIIIDLFYLVYYMALGGMYISSMSEIGLLGLAGFNRYIFTMVSPCVILGIIFFMKFSIANNKNIVTIIYTIIISLLILLFIIFYTGKDFKIKRDYKLFIGSNDYNTSYSKKFDNVLKNKYINEDNDLNYYVYISDKEINSAGYIYYMGRYKLNHGSILVITDLSVIKDIDKESTLIVLDNEKNIDKYIKQINFCLLEKGIYKSCAYVK